MARFVHRVCSQAMPLPGLISPCAKLCPECEICCWNQTRSQPCQARASQCYCTSTVWAHHHLHTPSRAPPWPPCSLTRDEHLSCQSRRKGNRCWNWGCEQRGALGGGGVTVWACGPFTGCFSSRTHLTAPLRGLPKIIGIKTLIDLGVRGGKTKKKKKKKKEKKESQNQNVYFRFRLSFIYFHFQWHNG